MMSQAIEKMKRVFTEETLSASVTAKFYRLNHRRAGDPVLKRDGDVAKNETFEINIRQAANWLCPHPDDLAGGEEHKAFKEKVGRSAFRLLAAKMIECPFCHLNDGFSPKKTFEGKVWRMTVKCNSRLCQGSVLPHYRLAPSEPLALSDYLYDAEHWHENAGIRDRLKLEAKRQAEAEAEAAEREKALGEPFTCPGCGMVLCGHGQKKSKAK